MRSIHADDVQQGIDWILEHPVKAYFTIRGDMIERMNTNAKLFINSAKGICIGIFGIIISVVFVPIHIAQLVLDPISKLRWYIGVLKKMRSGEFKAEIVEVKEDEDE